MRTHRSEELSEMENEVRFVVKGEPQGKGRPRITATYNVNEKKAHGWARTPEKTVIYENLVKMEYGRQCNDVRFPDGAMLDLRIFAYYTIPKSKSKKIKQMMREKVLRPIKKPDMDNVVKVIADSLNNVAYRDDTQIVDQMCRKFYSDEPRVEVIIRQIGG